MFYKVLFANNVLREVLLPDPCLFNYTTGRDGRSLSTSWTYTSGVLASTQRQPRSRRRPRRSTPGTSTGKAHRTTTRTQGLPRHSHRSWPTPPTMNQGGTHGETTTESQLRPKAQAWGSTYSHRHFTHLHILVGLYVPAMYIHFFHLLGLVSCCSFYLSKFENPKTFSFKGFGLFFIFSFLSSLCL